MEWVAIIISAVSIVIAIISFCFSIKSQNLQDKVNELDIEIKKYDLRQKEDENKREACVEARIIKISRNHYRMRVWNSGNASACNVVASIEEEANIAVYEKEKMPFEVLEPNKSFDVSVGVYMGSERKFKILTEWEDENGSNQTKSQFVDI